MKCSFHVYWLTQGYPVRLLILIEFTALSELLDSIVLGIALHWGSVLVW